MINTEKNSMLPFKPVLFHAVLQTPAEAVDGWIPETSILIFLMVGVVVSAIVAERENVFRTESYYTYALGGVFVVGWGAFFVRRDLTLLFAPPALLSLWMVAVTSRTDEQPDSTPTTGDGDIELGDLNTEPPGHDFDDVGGMDELKATLDDRVIQPLNNPKRYERYGIGAVNGVMFYGPPGCGKTFVAQAVAGETGYNFIEISPTDITSKYIGEAADNVAAVFETARENAPCLVFLDEIDAIAGDRSGNMTTSEQQMVNQLLTELERTDDDVVVFAATNYLDDVDSAILRSGRFDERIEIPPPDETARREILELSLADVPTTGSSDGDGLSYGTITAATSGYASSDIELFAEIAARHAMADARAVGHDHLHQALEETETSIPGWLDRYPNLDHHDSDEPDETPTLDGLRGMDSTVEMIRQHVIEPLETPERYEKQGVKTVDGVLLYGPPECDATTAARAIGAELQRPVIELSPSRLEREGKTDPVGRLTEIVDQAEARQPSVLLVDGLDALAPAVDGSQFDSQTKQRSRLISLLSSLTGSDVLVVATATLVEAVDSDVLYAGCFDEWIRVPLPDEASHAELIRDCLPADLLADDIDWEAVTNATAGFTIREISHVAHRAGRRAISEESTVGTDHLLDVISSISSVVDTREPQPHHSTPNALPSDLS